MTELELYKFIDENDIEYHWWNEDVIMFIPICFISIFTVLLTSGIFDDGGIKCTLKDGYICLEMNDICEYYDINMENVFEKSK